MRPYEVARSRLNRAISHGESLSRMWNAIPAEKFFGIRVRVDQNGFGNFRIVGVGKIPEEFALLLGEKLYQLRSALDACIYQAAVYANGGNSPPPHEGRLEFPICPTKEEFNKQAARRLSTLPTAIQSAIEKLQPYNTPALPPEDMVTNLNRSLSILHDLARKDRHRKLHVVGSMPVKLDPYFPPLPQGVTVDWIKPMDPGLLKEGTILATFHLSGFVWGMSLEANPNLVTNIGCDEPPPPCHVSDTFERRMVEMINAVGSVVNAFETHF
jgi:hypothetical protein